MTKAATGSVLAISDAHGLDLHDRSTRGQPLTSAEQAELQAWYSRVDAEEFAAIAPQLAMVVPESQRAALEAVIHQVLDTQNRIRNLTEANADTCRKIEALKEQLARKAAAQTT